MNISAGVYETYIHLRKYQ